MGATRESLSFEYIDCRLTPLRPSEAFSLTCSSPPLEDLSFPFPPSCGETVVHCPMDPRQNPLIHSVEAGRPLCHTSILLSSRGASASPRSRWTVATYEVFSLQLSWLINALPLAMCPTSFTTPPFYLSKVMNLKGVDLRWDGQAGRGMDHPEVTLNCKIPKLTDHGHHPRVPPFDQGMAPSEMRGCENTLVDLGTSWLPELTTVGVVWYAVCNDGMESSLFAERVL